MYVIREVLHCKPGKVRQMADKFRSLSATMKDMGPEPLRLLTDVTGEPFWTVVAEATVERIEAVVGPTRLSPAKNRLTAATVDTSAMPPSQPQPATLTSPGRRSPISGVSSHTRSKS